MTDQTTIIAAQQRRLIGVTVVVAGAVLWMWIAREYGAEAAMFAITIGVGAIAIALYWALRNMTPVSLFLVASVVGGCICLPDALVELGYQLALAAVSQQPTSDTVGSLGLRKRTSLVPASLYHRQARPTAA